MPEQSLVIRPVEAGAILSLRQRILRPTQTLAEVGYPEDGAVSTFHLGAYLHGELAGCCTGLARNHPAIPDASYQLRGMAVDQELQQTGIGKHLLAAFEQGCQARGATRIWCQARDSALGFYGKFGWCEIGEGFLLVGIPHRLMWKQL